MLIVEELFHMPEKEIILNKAIHILKLNLSFDVLAGGETAGIPYAAFLSEKLKMPMIYIRKKIRDLELISKLKANLKRNKSITSRRFSDRWRQ